jgi:hypothetical protein
MDADKSLRIEDIIRRCILRQFLILIFVYIIGGALFILLTGLYFASIAIVPWRIKPCVTKFRVICQKIRLKYKGMIGKIHISIDPQNIIDLAKALGRNFEDLVLDFAVLGTFLTFVVTSVLSTWRIPSQVKWFRDNKKDLTENLSKSIQGVYFCRGQARDNYWTPI